MKLNTWFFGALATFAVTAAPIAEGSFLSSCHVSGFDERVECGMLSVPEDYANPDGKRIDIHVVRVPAVASAKEDDPLLFLAGGPGQAATELVAQMAYVFRDVRRTRDLIFIDQRGTGNSNPLQCPNDDLELVYAHLAVADEELDLTGEIVRCAEELDANFQAYTTRNAVRDFDAVRAALGYSQFNLYGGSYGTRTGLAYLRDFPDSVRVAVLDGLAPPQVKIGLFGTSSQHAFEKMLADCEEQTACANAFPNLREQYRTLVDSLQSQPITLQLRDPRSYRLANVRMTANRLNQMIFPALYSPRMRQMLPLVISEAAAGNYVPLTGLVGSFEQEPMLYLGLTLSVVCQEDIPRITDEERASEAASSFMGNMMLNNFERMCAGWPVVPNEEPIDQPVVSDIPTLLLSGGLDAVTPPAWGELTATTLSASQHYVAAAGGHTIASHTCANRLVAQFIQDPNSTIDASCLAETPKLPYLLNVNASGM